MTRLLVSVRDAAEALAALAGGADLIDVKEPRRGSLGAADAEVIAQVVQAVNGRRPVSAALGELIDHSSAREDEMLQRLSAGVAFAKLGLARCGPLSDWPRRWERALEQFPSHVAPVAVIYADWRGAAAPSPAEVLSQGQRLGCRAVLLDTFDKTRGGLLDHWGLPQVIEYVQSARDAGLISVLAGSLTADTIQELRHVAPDYFAVRGAACRGGRAGPLDQARVQLLSSKLAGKEVAPLPVTGRLETGGLVTISHGDGVPGAVAKRRSQRTPAGASPAAQPPDTHQLLMPRGGLFQGEIQE